MKIIHACIPAGRVFRVKNSYCRSYAAKTEKRLIRIRKSEMRKQWYTSSEISKEGRNAQEAKAMRTETFTRHGWGFLPAMHTGGIRLMFAENVLPLVRNMKEKKRRNERMKLILTALTLVVFLAGCGGYKPPVENNSAGNTPEASKPADTATPEAAPAEGNGAEAALEFDYPDAGFTLKLPESFTDIIGYYDEPKDYGELEVGSGVVYGSLNIYLRTPEEIAEHDAMLASIKTEDDVTDEIREKHKKYCEGIVQVYSILGVNGGRTYKDIEYMASDTAMIKKVIDLGEFDDYHYYSCIVDLDYEKIKEPLSQLNPEAVEKYRKIMEEVEAHPEYVVLKKRQPGFIPPEIGSEISFEGKDLDGNPVSSKELFAENDITMINIWRTWCSVCVEEFPEMNELAKKYADRKVGVITYCADAEDEELTEKAINIIGEYDGFKKNLAFSESTDNALPWNSTPMTYFVDKEGKVLCNPIKGAAPDMYPEYLDKLLNHETIVSQFDTPEVRQDNTYTVLVADQNDNPVPGVVVGFCTDVNCSIAQSDANGFAIFTGPEYPYHVKVIEVPKGYTYDKEYSDTMDADGGSVILKITKN